MQQSWGNASNMSWLTLFYLELVALLLLAPDDSAKGNAGLTFGWTASVCPKSNWSRSATSGGRGLTTVPLSGCGNPVTIGVDVAVVSDMTWLPNIGGRYFGFDSVSCALLSTMLSSSSSSPSLWWLSFSSLMLNVEPGTLSSALMSDSSCLVSATYGGTKWAASRRKIIFYNSLLFIILIWKETWNIAKNQQQQSL